VRMIIRIISIQGLGGICIYNIYIILILYHFGEHMHIHIIY